MSETNQSIAPVLASDTMERVLLMNDLSRLNAGERLNYYNAVCHSLELNPLTQPFKYIHLNGKLTLYATKDCTEQLRKRDGVSVRIVSREFAEGVYIVIANAKNNKGREDESIGAVAIEGLRGEAKANAIMKAETKAKRRVTLSICGLGMMDEEEFDPEFEAMKPADSEIIPGGDANEVETFKKREAEYELRDRKRLEEQGIDPAMNESIQPKTAKTAAVPEPVRADWRDFDCSCVRALNGQKLGDVPLYKMKQVQEKWLKQRVESDQYDGALDAFKTALETAIKELDAAEAK